MVVQIPKQTLRGLLVALIATLFSSGMTSAQSSGVFQNFQYTATATEITITRYPSNFGGSITVPSTINGLPVTTIGYSAFSNCYALTSITLPTSVRTLDVNAFQSCSSLSGFTIPSSVTTIRDNVFVGCSKLASISVSSSNYAYSSLDGILYNKSRTTLIKIPEYKSGALSLPSTLTSIRETQNCSRITSVSIPAAVTSLSSPFAGSRMLVSINVAPANPNYSSRDGMLFNKDYSELIRVPGGKTGKVVVEEGMSFHRGFAVSSAFYTAYSIEEVVLPASTTSIPSDLFSKCESLRTFVIPDGCTRIGVEKSAI